MYDSNRCWSVTFEFVESAQHVYRVECVIEIILKWFVLKGYLLSYKVNKCQKMSKITLEISSKKSLKNLILII